MLFLGIDQHARQLTVSLRDQYGDVLLARQVSLAQRRSWNFSTKSVTFQMAEVAIPRSLFREILR